VTAPLPHPEWHQVEEVEPASGLLPLIKTLAFACAALVWALIVGGLL
jgi:hypothetical protein